MLLLSSAVLTYAQDQSDGFLAPSDLTEKQIDDFNKKWKKAYELSKDYMFLSDQKHKKADRKQLEKAIKLYKGGLKIVPDHWASYFLMGKTYQALGEHNDAYDAFSKAYTINPDHKDVLNEYMIEAMETSKFDEAVNLLEANQHRWPDDVGIRGNYAFALLLAGQTDKSIEALLAVEKLWPNDPITKRVMSMALKIQSGQVPQPKTLEEFYALK